jgi:outer membrane murein-binding lipoprotein Lpp
MNDELNALVESEATLSDEFKAKTAVIFETAIRSKLSEEVERLEDEYQSRLEEELDATRSDLVEKVDSYLNYVVENWMQENKLAVEAGLRTEIAEGFMDKLKDLFVESYIEVPESKIDLVDELAEQVEELEVKSNEQTATIIEMSEQIEQHQREAIIREHARDLAETEVEKLNSLVESLDFEDQEAFAEKVKTVKESYFKKEVKNDEELNEDWDADQTQQVSSVMDMYLSAIKKTHK